MGCSSCQQNNHIVPTTTVDSVCECACGCAEPVCATPQPCTEITDAKCTVYTGEDILSGYDVVVTKNSSVSTALNQITNYFSNVLAGPKIPADILCGTTVVIPKDTLPVDAFPLLVTYVCSQLTIINATLVSLQNQINLKVSTVTGLNTDNTDPQNPIVKISVDGTTVTGLGTPASPLVALISNLVSVSYSQLSTLISTNALVPDKHYLINDFQTVYDQPDYSAIDTPKAVVATLTGPVEPLIVTAVANNKISNVALSTVFPNDHILYDQTFAVTEVMGVAAKGRISQRTDTSNNTVSYDSRNVVFKRYFHPGFNDYSVYYDNGNASASFPTFRNLTHSYNNHIINEPVGVAVDVISFGFLLNNTVALGDMFNVTAGDMFYNNTIEDLKNTTFENGCRNNVFRSVCFDNIVGPYFFNNVVHNFRGNTIGTNFQNNIIIDCIFNTIGGEFQNNSALKMQGNIIESSFKNNIATGDIDYNKIGAGFKNNTLGSFSKNNIGNSFDNNITGHSFSYNNIGINFINNNIGTDFESNALGNGFQNNIIGDNFENNNIGDSFDTNTVGDSVHDLFIQNNYTGVNIPTGTNTETDIEGLATGFVKNTNGVLQSIAFGTSAEYVRGDGVLATFPTIPPVPPIINNVTFIQLQTLISTAGLVQGAGYLITDFQTVYDQPDFSAPGVAKTTVATLTGPIEPLIVIAASTTDISNQAISTVYPDDRILYDHTFVTTEVMGVAAKGRITERTDTSNNTINYDHRNVVFKRYEQVPGSGDYYIYWDNGNVSINNIPTFADLTISFNNYFASNNDNVFLPSLTMPFLLNNTVFLDTDIFELKVNHNFYNNTFKFPVRDVTFGSNCYNNLINGLTNSIIGNNFINNTTRYIQNSTIGTECLNNSIGNIEWSEIQTFFQNNIFNGNHIKLTKIGHNFKNNTTTGDFDNIEVSWGCDTNTFDGAVSCIIGHSFSDNIIGSNFGGCNIDYNFKRNVIGSTFAGNIIGQGFQDNNIGNGFEYNTTGDQFIDNVIGDFATNNIFDYAAANNTIGNNFKSNTIGGAADYFSVGYLVGFYQNTIGTDVINNTFGIQFMNNTLGDYFDSNTFGNYCWSNQLADNLLYNTFGDFFINNIITPIVGIPAPFYNNIFGNGCNFNTLKDAQFNTIGNGFVSNNIDEAFGYNHIGDFASNNNIGLGFNYNNILNGFQQNNILTYFRNNIIANDFDANVIADNFENNTIDYGFLNNTSIGSRFKFNNIKVGFKNNIVGDDFNYNVVNSNFSDNTINNDFKHNTIGNEFNSNTIDVNCLTNTFGNFNRNNNIAPNFLGNITSDLFENNTIGLNFKNNSVGETFATNTIGINFQNNAIGDNFTVNIIGDNTSSNNIGNNFFTNNIGVDFNDNTIGNNFKNNIITDNFILNNIGNIFEDNTIANDFKNNTIGNNFQINTSLGIFTNNSIGNFFIDNTVGNNFNYNIIDESVHNNTIGYFCEYNNIGSDFNANTIGNNFRNNKVGINFSANILGTNFRENTIGSHFFTNTVAVNFFNNTIKNECTYNTIGNDASFNIIDYNFYNNDIGTDFINNTIGNDFSTNTVGNLVHDLFIQNGYDNTTIASGTNTETDIEGLATGFVKNTNGVLQSIAFGTAAQYVRGDGVLATLPGGGGGTTVINESKAIYIDATYGNDTTGAKYDLATPYLTWTAAIAAAVTGDLIIFNAGTYTESVMFPLDNINVYCKAGVIFTGTFRITGSITWKFLGNAVFPTSTALDIQNNAGTGTGKSYDVQFDFDRIEGLVYYGIICTDTNAALIKLVINCNSIVSFIPFRLNAGTNFDVSLNVKHKMSGYGDKTIYFHNSTLASMTGSIIINCPIIENTSTNNNRVVVLLCRTFSTDALPLTCIINANVIRSTSPTFTDNGISNLAAVVIVENVDNLFINADLEGGAIPCIINYSAGATPVYGNVTFTGNMYSDREIVQHYQKVQNGNGWHNIIIKNGYIASKGIGSSNAMFHRANAWNSVHNGIPGSIQLVNCIVHNENFNASATACIMKDDVNLTGTTGWVIKRNNFQMYNSLAFITGGIGFLISTIQSNKETMLHNVRSNVDKMATVTDLLSPTGLIVDANLIIPITKL